MTASEVGRKYQRCVGRISLRQLCNVLISGNEVFRRCRCGPGIHLAADTQKYREIHAVQVGEVTNQRVIVGAGDNGTAVTALVVEVQIHQKCVVALFQRRPVQITPVFQRITAVPSITSVIMTQNGFVGIFLGIDHAVTGGAGQGAAQIRATVQNAAFRLVFCTVIGIIPAFGFTHHVNFRPGIQILVGGIFCGGAFICRCRSRQQRHQHHCRQCSSQNALVFHCWNSFLSSAAEFHRLRAAAVICVSLYQIVSIPTIRFQYFFSKKTPPSRESLFSLHTIA